MIKASDVLSLYEKRDATAKAEQKLEDEIFRKDKQFSETEANALGKAYQQAKDRRAKASIDAAVAYMQLSPKDKEYVTTAWAKSSEGKRKAQGSGIRGQQTKKN